MAPAAAEAAANRFVGRRRHVFPGCFVCGTGRAGGDGLRNFPGPVDGRGLVAAPWVRLLIRAREEGVRALEAITLVDNHAALALLRGLGFRVCSDDGGRADLRLSLESRIASADAA